MRFLTAALTGLIAVALLLASRSSQEVRQTAAAQEGADVERHWFKVVFGLDEKDAAWDGRVSVTNGRLVQLEGWSFEARDQLDRSKSSWKIRTSRIQGRRATYAEPTRGLLLEIEGDSTSRVTLETARGEIAFLPLSVDAGRPAKFLNDRVSVERLGESEVVAVTETDDDFTSIAVDHEGSRHVLWQSYDDSAKRDWLFVRNVDDPDSQPESIFDAVEFASPYLFALRDGDGSQLRAVWCSPGEHRNWDVYSAVKTKAGWKPERLTTAHGSDVHLTADVGPDGSLWIAWQSFRSGIGHIFARRLTNGRWSKEIAVETGRGDAWEPAISVAQDGSAWVGFDSYEHGNYDVFVRHVDTDDELMTVGERIAVATSADFEAHTCLLADGDDVWVAYDAGGPNWGKDFRSRETITNGVYSEPLHASRRIELRLVREGKTHQPARPLPQIRPPDRIHAIERSATAKPSRFYEYPQLTRDGDGRLWLLFRMCRQGYCAHPPMGIDWRGYATSFSRDGWLEPIEIPMSQGRQNQRISSAVGADGRLVLAWAEGNRFASIDRKYSVRHGRLPFLNEKAAEIPVEPVELDEPTVAADEPHVDMTLEKNGEIHHVYFGDLHRHTNISRCMPTIDGSLDDAHRYALNAVQYDFLAVTDHTRDVDPFSWWRTQKAADWYHVPGRYVPIYAYERSNGTVGGGHRNVFFINRGAEINPSDHWADGVGREKPETNPDTTLYPWLKERGDALTAAHTPVYEKNADKGTWTYNDPQVEPVAEIFQGFRRSYERPGNGVVEQASLWHALRKGHRLGFIASSDHMSTHVSFACVWATKKTREAIFEGLRSRRTYAATDRIGLVFRIGQAVMGEEVRIRGDQITMRIRAECTAPLRELQVVRSGRVLETLKPGVSSFDQEFVDDNPLDGPSYYYVRLIQADGAIAWGSPIWVRREN